MRKEAASNVKDFLISYLVRAINAINCFFQALAEQTEPEEAFPANRSGTL